MQKMEAQQPWIRMNILEFQRFMKSRRICAIETPSAVFHSWKFILNPNVMQLNGIGKQMSFWRIRSMLVLESCESILVRVLYCGHDHDMVHSYDMILRVVQE